MQHPLPPMINNTAPTESTWTIDTDAIDEAIADLKALHPPCTWTLDNDDDGDQRWSTACGETFEFITGGPDDNNFRYCPGCCKRIEVT